jgi:hypothetical protein
VNPEEGCRHEEGLTECLLDQYAKIRELIGKLDGRYFQFVFSGLRYGGQGQELYSTLALSRVARS